MKQSMYRRRSNRVAELVEEGSSSFEKIAEKDENLHGSAGEEDLRVPVFLNRNRRKMK